MHSDFEGEGWANLGIDLQEQVWIRTWSAGPWHSHREMKAGPAMGWSRPGAWCVGRGHSACTQLLQAKSSDPSLHKRKVYLANNFSAEMDITPDF